MNVGLSNEQSSLISVGLPLKHVNAAKALKALCEHAAFDLLACGYS